MITSDTTAALDEAMAVALSQIAPAVKTARGHNYSYAALDEVIDSAMTALTSNGIALSQGIEWQENRMVIVTRIAFKGEWMKIYFPMVADEGKRMNGMQALGSASTYARRYAIQCALGIAPITENKAASLNLSARDDDGVRAGVAPLERVRRELLSYGSNLAEYEGILGKRGLYGQDDINECQSYETLNGALEDIRRTASTRH